MCNYFITLAFSESHMYSTVLNSSQGHSHCLFQCFMKPVILFFLVKQSDQRIFFDSITGIQKILCFVSLCFSSGTGRVGAFFFHELHLFIHFNICMSKFYLQSFFRNLTHTVIMTAVIQNGEQFIENSKIILVIVQPLKFDFAIRYIKPDIVCVHFKNLHAVR